MKYIIQTFLLLGVCSVKVYGNADLFKTSNKMKVKEPEGDSIEDWSPVSKSSENYLFNPQSTIQRSFKDPAEFTFTPLELPDLKKDEIQSISDKIDAIYLEIGKYNTETVTYYVENFKNMLKIEKLNKGRSDYESKQGDFHDFELAFDEKLQRAKQLLEVFDQENREFMNLYASGQEQSKIIKSAQRLIFGTNSLLKVLMQDDDLEKKFHLILKSMDQEDLKFSTNWLYKIFSETNMLLSRISAYVTSYTKAIQNLYLKLSSEYYEFSKDVKSLNRVLADLSNIFTDICHNLQEFETNPKEDIQSFALDFAAKLAGLNNYKKKLESTYFKENL